MSDIKQNDLETVKDVAALQVMMENVMDKLKEISIDQKELYRSVESLRDDNNKMRMDISGLQTKFDKLSARIEDIQGASILKKLSKNWYFIVMALGGASGVIDWAWRLLSHFKI